MDFLIAGIQKGGTSALHNYLKLHPQLVPPERIKELHFFYGDNKSVNWYHRQFPKLCYRNMLCYESTPDYICGYHFMEYIAQYKAKYSQKLKLILIFRDPVSRAYSQWNMTKHFIDVVNDPQNEEGRTLRKYNPQAFDLYRAMETLPSFERCFEDFFNRFEKISPVDDLRQLNLGGQINYIPGQFFLRGLYVFTLNALLDFFRREELLILESTELKFNTSETLDRVVRFLNISPYQWPESEISVPHHVSCYRNSIDTETENRIKSFYAPFNEKFFELTKKNYNW